MAYAADGQRRRGRPPRISRDDIVDAACELGIGNLTMAAVAERLGVTHQSLYGWVQDRDELIDLVSDRLIRRLEIVPPAGPEDWRDSLRSYANDLRHLAEEMPGFAAAGLGRFRTSEGYVNINDAVVRVLNVVGFESSVAQRMLDTLNTVLLGWLTREHALSGVRQVPSDRFGSLSVEELGASPDERFEFLIHTLLAGLPDPPQETGPGDGSELPIDLRSVAVTSAGTVHEVV